jgi:phosphopantetheinyl transferase (holo-ACP synthase)
MIGIDLTRISRFEKLDLNRLGKMLGHEIKTPTEAAKVWACYEALTKAEGKKINFKKINLVFAKGCSPTVNDSPFVFDSSSVLSGPYILSLTHEDDYVAVVALRKDIK